MVVLAVPTITEGFVALEDVLEPNGAEGAGSHAAQWH